MESAKGRYLQINKSFNVCAFDDYLKAQIASLPILPHIEQLTPRVIRVLGQNPGKFSLQGTNTYIIGTGSHRLVIDTSSGEAEWADLIKATLESKGVSLTHVLLTHHHGDHTGGVPDLIRMYPHLEGAVYKNSPDSTQQPIHDGQIFSVEGATVRALHVPGHAEDHMCFILEEEETMFTGDNVLGHGTTVFEDLGTFMASLQRMYDQNCLAGYPGHGGTISDLPGKITAELASKLRRERQVLQALRRMRDRGMRSADTQTVVTEIYGTVLDTSTRNLALEPFIDDVLRKLAGEGKVAFEMRSGKRKWYPVEVTQRARDRRLSIAKRPLNSVKTVA